MKTTQGNTQVSLEAVDAFLDQNAATLAAVVNTGARRKLAAVIADLTTHTSNQTGTLLVSKGSTIDKENRRLALLRDHMAPIASIARSELPQTDALLPLRMPRGRPTTPKVVAAARGMAHAAAPYASVFIDNGLPADFIEQLDTAATTLASSLVTHATLRGSRKSATAGLKAKLASGRRLVHILDKYVKSALKDDPILLAGWNSVKRVNRTGTRTTATTSPNTPAPPPTPAPAPAST